MKQLAIDSYVRGAAFNTLRRETGRTPQQADIDDAAQDAMLDIFEQESKGTQDIDIGRAAVNAAYRAAYAAFGRSRPIVERDENGNRTERFAPQTGPLPAGLPAPPVYHDFELDDSLAALPERQRQIVEARLERCDDQETARRLGTSVHVVRAELDRIHRSVWRMLPSAVDYCQRQRKSRLPAVLPSLHDAVPATA